MDLEFLGDSTCIRAAGYQGGYLTIQFESGEVVTYEEVPPQVWVGLKRSTSKGYTFNRNIRNNYSFFYGTAPDTGPLSYIDAKYFDDMIVE